MGSPLLSAPNFALISSRVKPRDSISATIPAFRSISLSVSVSPNVLARAQEFAAEAIWMRTDVQNGFELEVRNVSDQVLVEKIAIFLRDVEKDTITDLVYSGVCTAQPNSVDRIPFRISELPYKGVVRLSAQSTASELSARPSGNIVVAERSEIEFGN